MEITCPNCNAQNAAKSRFCSKCGEALPFQSEAPQQESSGLDLPWLRSVQEQAEKPPTEKLTGAQVEQHAQPERPAGDEDPSPPAVPIEAQTQSGDSESTDTTAELPEGPPDEPPPGWVVSILEPAAPQPSADQQTYEPEELAHIMPWSHGSASPEDAIAGENVPGLPPWLNNITVQETLQAANATPTPTTPHVDLDELDLEGIEPFAPPTGYEDLPAQVDAAAEIKPIEQVPEWLRSITANAPVETGASSQTDTAPPAGVVPPTVAPPS